MKLTTLDDVAKSLNNRRVAVSPTGTGDDTALLQQALANNWTLGPGDFYYKGTGETVGYNSLSGVRNKTNIILADGAVFIHQSQAYSNLAITNITFKGGAGAILVDAASTLGNGKAVTHVSGCEFYDYTVAALAKTQVDLPHWQVTDCTFKCASGSSSTAMGIALDGAIDNTIISGNRFQLNQIHVKLGSAGQNATVANNDFVQFAAGSKRANIWIVPTATQLGAKLAISNNKHGSETQDPSDFRILVADAAAGNFYTALPVLNVESQNYAIGALIQGEGAWGQNSSCQPLVVSTTHRFRVCDIDAPMFYGTSPSYVLQYLFSGPSATDQVTVRNVRAQYTVPALSNIATVTNGIPASTSSSSGAWSVDANGNPTVDPTAVALGTDTYGNPTITL